MTLSTTRFPNRPAGSAHLPFVVEVRGASGSLLNLTGRSATLTLRKMKGVTAVMQAVPNDNTPDIGGVFSFPATAAHVSSHGEYLATVSMDLGNPGKPEVATYALTITPATPT